jgi:Ergosterol biosynthesis ERG4/ERG24 family
MDITSLPKPSVNYASYLDLQAVGIVFGWLVLQLILASIPVGWTRVGSNLPDGSKLHYRCNGWFQSVFGFFKYLLAWYWDF